MKSMLIPWLVLGLLGFVGSARGQDDTVLRHEQEKHLRNIRQLTFGGQNAEAYFSADGSRLIFQSTRDELECDQIFTMTTEGDSVTMVSTGKGRTTCAFWATDGASLLYASTHLGAASCPPPPDYSQGYVWAVYSSFDIFRARPDGSELVRLTHTPGYDAEAVYSHDGQTILFTSARDGDLDLYTMNPDGSDVTRLTTEVGYDGGAFFSPNDSLICWRADRPADSAAVTEFKRLLGMDLIRPRDLELFVMRRDGSEQRRVTQLGGANFCPYFTPDGEHLLFSSNHHSESGREFDLFLVDLNGGPVEQITFTAAFDGFPMFSPDGTKLVWCSNRNGTVQGETNVFICDWVP
jgi:Tol biopolymer transport system component